jgi:protocatechuate 3,4-dioxygenase beta subunit
MPVTLIAVLSVLLSSSLMGQAPTGGSQGVRPGIPGGAQAPGMPPPRDNRAAPSGTARLRGRVVAAQTGLPLRRAQVTATSPEGQTRRVTTTDGEGRYEFVELPAGRFSVAAMKAGYVQQQYGQRRPFEAGTPVTIAEGETAERIDFTLSSGSVITVRVTDDFGEPLAGAQVQVQRFQYGPDGERRLTMAPGGMPFMSSTDDRGEIRLYGLSPGEYVIGASVRNIGIALPGAANPNDTNEGFSPTYYPGTISTTEAQAVSIAAGEERSVQFAMVAARLARISGTVMTSEGRPATGAQLIVVTRSGGTGMSTSGVGNVGADGGFTISGVAPGDHSVEVRPQPRPGEPSGEFASVPVVVSGSDITGLRIVTGKGASLSGRVVFEGTSKRDGSAAPLRVLAMPADPMNRPMFFAGGDPLSNGTVDEKGNFQLAAGSGRVFLMVTTPPLWVIKSVTLDGNDITDEPLELTGKQSISSLVIRLTDKLTQISGRVSDGRGQLLRDYVVVIQPTEAKEPIVASRWIRTARPDTSGRFETRGMRPGRYVATAIEALEQGRQFAPEFQEQLRHAGREFSVREGESIALDLTLTPNL